MEIDVVAIRSFRHHLRQFERIIANHSRTCCKQVSTAQCHVLLQIAAAEDVTASVLAHDLGLDISTISRTVDSLVNANLVVRSGNPSDRRSITLRVTEEGKTLCRSIDQDADAYFASVIATIPKVRRRAILRNFAELVDAFVLFQSFPAGISSSCSRTKSKGCSDCE